MQREFPRPPYPSQKQPMPGLASKMDPRPDHGERSYTGSGKLEGLKAIITGGDSGIGRAVAIAYAREGADVLIAYLNETEDAEEVKELIEKEGRKAVLVAGDVCNPRHCRSIVQRAVSELGGVDILVNNAAHQATFKDIADISDDEWEITFKTNIHAMLYLTKAAVPHMKPGSAIINTASGWGLTGGAKAAVYCASKGAVVLLTKAMAVDHGPEKVRVNCICPGDIDTSMLRNEAQQLGQPADRFLTEAARRPMGRIGTPEEIAQAALYLASDASSFVTGTALVVDGGGLAGSV